MPKLRVILRRFASRPGFTALSLLTLAIGIGANVAIFTIVNGVLLRPLPFPDSDRVVILNHAAPGLPNMDELPMSPALYFLYSRDVDSFESVTFFSSGQSSFTGLENPERVSSGQVTASFFDVVRTPPGMGRPFVAEDEVPGAAPVTILSDFLWRGRFGADPSILGRRVEIDGTTTEVVGVMSPGFIFPADDVQIWRPFELDEERSPLGAFNSVGMARLADGVPIETARAEVGGMLANLPDLFPEHPAAPVLANAGFGPLFDPAHEFVVGDIQATLWVLLAAVGFLLLIACANVANLFLARAEGRHNEITIRFALGESRAGLMGAMVTEGVLLGAAAGLVAVPVGLGAVQLLVRLGPQQLPRLAEVTVDGQVLGFAALLSVVAGALLGLLPALRVGAMAAHSRLVEGARGASAGRERHLARRVLVVSQIALALTLLVGSGLAARSFWRLSRVDPGFDATGALTFRLELPSRDYSDGRETLVFHRRLVERLESIPGVESAAAAQFVPLSGIQNGSGYSFEDHPRPEDEPPPVVMQKQVSASYFETMGIDILEGRSFDELDEERLARIAIVSRQLAREYWPDRSALGRGLNSGGPPPEGTDWYRIVGVVDDVFETNLREDARPLIYYPLALPRARARDGARGTDGTDGTEAAEPDVGDEPELTVPRAATFVVRAESVGAIAEPVRKAVAEVDANLPISDVQTLETLVRQARSRSAFVMLLLAVAAGFALLLGSVGLYGVVSYGVAQRGREIAIRMAVGAQAREVRGMVLREAGGLALIGTAIGVLAAVALTRRLQALLFETSPLEPSVFLAVSALLVAVCLVASWVPARRASRVAPVTALRDE